MSSSSEEPEIRAEIYVIRNTMNPKVYVGQTVTWRKSGKHWSSFGHLKRFQEHCNYSTRKKLSILGRAINELGRDNFRVELLEVCDLDQADERERAWIDQLASLYPRGYNVLYGPPYAVSPEARAKISETLKEYFQIPDVRKEYSLAHRNQFKALPPGDITRIRLRPIMKNNEPDIIYMYISIQGVPDDIRRRYGGIHEDFEEASIRCYSDALMLVNQDESRVATVFDRELPYLNAEGLVIEKVEVKLHKMKEHRMVALYVTSSLYVEPKRHVFGGKRQDFLVAHRRAMQFVESIYQAAGVVDETKRNITIQPALLQHLQTVREVP